MLKTGLRVAVIGATLGLVACAGGTPKCGASEVQDNLKSIAEERLAELASTEGTLPGLAEAIRDRVSYAFTSIRTVEHDESADTYQCASLLSVMLDGGKNGKWELGFEYTVYSVEEADSDYEVDYDPLKLVGLGEAAGKINQEMVWEGNRETEVRDWSERLQRARDGGAAWSEYEEELVTFIRKKGGEIPDVTPAQRKKSIEERIILDDPMEGFVNPPEDVVAEIRSRHAQRVGAQAGVASEPVQEVIGEQPNGDVVGDGGGQDPGL